MSLTIDSQRCQGHGRCALINDGLFDVSEDGQGVVLVDDPGPEYVGDIAKAVDNCPEAAITYVATDTA
jgi:ferredoxin